MTHHPATPQTNADELLAANELLKATVPGTARIIRSERLQPEIVVICDRHDDPDNPPSFLGSDGCCSDCEVIVTYDPAVARHLAALINARPALAAWLQGMTENYSGVRSGSQRKPPAGSNLAHALAIARTINGSVS